MAYVRLEEVVEKMNLENLTPEIDISGRKVRQSEVNRPALELTGYFDHFAAGRIQIIGLVEHSYIDQMEEQDEREMFEKLFSLDVPMVIFTRGLMPDETILEIAHRKKMPMYLTNQATSPFMAEILRWLNVKLAPCISVHGVLVDVYGIGLLLTGDSGVGKSEAALELIKRGHRLVSDDVVEIRRVSEVTLIGTAPEITKHFIELRGIGIIDVKTLFGVSSVRESQSIDLEIHLEEWDRNREYDRLGLEESYSEYLGNKVVCHRVPVRPGRNVAIICESAAANHRQKLMGYNAAQELYQRFQKNLMRKHSENDDDED
ncbi:MAG: HPr(Ser) kinase/phosphatase [Lachnospiraceae bacterium]|nr:HPr(Ser) kinase/phosphatase [Lachnospiraceae bacterium]